MAWVEITGNTTTLTGSGTEDSIIAAQTKSGLYIVACDLNAIVNGDSGEIRIYTKVRTGATARVIHRFPFSNVPSNPNWQSPPIVVGTGDIAVKIAQDTGTGRAVITSLIGDLGALIRQNTCQTDGSPDSTHMVLDGSASAIDDYYNGMWVAIVGGTGLGQAPRAITDYVGSTKRALIDPALTTNVDNTTEFAIFA